MKTNTLLQAGNLSRIIEDEDNDDKNAYSLSTYRNQVTQVVTEQSYKGTIMILSYLIMKEGSEIALVVFEFRIHVFISLFSWKRIEELKLKKKLSGYAEDSILTVS